MRTHVPSGTVTFLFTDIEGSTQLWERHPEAMKSALAKHDELLRHIFESYNGYIFKTIGDAFCVAFTSPSDALQASLESQQTLIKENWGDVTLKVRMGLHTGEADERGGDYFGPPLNRAARLMSAGHGGQILLSIATQELIRDRLPKKTSLRDLGEHRLKDLFRPERVYQFNSPDLPAEFPPLRTLDARRTNLPAQPTPLVGREHEVAAILNLLRRDDVRLVTLTGPGGTGKTRLSLQAAADLIDEYEHGVYFINLSPINNPDLVLPAIAGPLRVPESSGIPLAEVLHAYLRSKNMLLVLDNFEQIIPAASQVGELLAAAPNLKLLVTSREILHLRGEHDYPVPPLGLPQRGRKPTLAVLSQYESVALFIQRAKAARPDFEINDDNAPAIAEICTRLDGLPLAIELADARSRMLTPQVMLEKLSSRLKTLTGGARDLPARQQTLRGAIDWSYDLLTEPEKKLFARLSVFQGGRSIPAVEAVCGSALELDVLEGLESLLNKSLLRQEENPNGEARFIMLETIHEYARERLSESEESETIQRRHAEFFDDWLNQIKFELRGGSTQLKRFEQVEIEHGNLQTALEWSLAGADIELGLRMVGVLFNFWWRQGHGLEWKYWMQHLPQHLDKFPESVQAETLLAMGALEFYGGGRDIQAGKQFCQEALAIYRRLEDRINIAWTIGWLIAGSIGIKEDYDEAIALAEEAITLSRDEGDLAGVARHFNLLGNLAESMNDRKLARASFQESLDIAHEIGDQLREYTQYLNLAAFAEVEEGQHEHAATLYRRGLTWAVESGSIKLILYNLSFMPRLIFLRGQPAEAARLVGASEALNESLGFKLEVFNQSEVDGDLSLIRKQLGDETFNALIADGRVMSMEEAIEFALTLLRS